jgi:hypothetical protein
MEEETKLKKLYALADEVLDRVDIIALAEFVVRYQKKLLVKLYRPGRRRKPSP